MHDLYTVVLELYFARATIKSALREADYSLMYDHLNYMKVSRTLKVLYTWLAWVAPIFLNGQANPARFYVHILPVTNGTTRSVRKHTMKVSRCHSNLDKNAIPVMDPVYSEYECLSVEGISMVSNGKS